MKVLIWNLKYLWGSWDQKVWNWKINKLKKFWSLYSFLISQACHIILLLIKKISIKLRIKLHKPWVFPFSSLCSKPFSRWAPGSSTNMSFILRTQRSFEFSRGWTVECKCIFFFENHKNRRTTLSFLLLILNIFSAPLLAYQMNNKFRINVQLVTKSHVTLISVH